MAGGRIRPQITRSLPILQEPQKTKVLLKDYVGLPQSWRVGSSATFRGNVTITVTYDDDPAVADEDQATSFVLLKDRDGDGYAETLVLGETTVDTDANTATATYDGLCLIVLALRPLDERDGVVVRVEPEVINLNSKGIFTVFMDLPSFVDPLHIDLGTFTANGELPVPLR